jgi:hypothetical protein
MPEFCCKKDMGVSMSDSMGTEIREGWVQL